MARRKQTGFDKYLSKRMKDPAFAKDYRQARAEIDATDALIRALDEARQRTGLTKADLARKIDAKPEIVRRLLTDKDGNPTMNTVFKVADALGYHIQLVRNRAPKSGRRVLARTKAAKKRRTRRGLE